MKLLLMLTCVVGCYMVVVAHPQKKKRSEETPEVFKMPELPAVPGKRSKVTKRTEDEPVVLEMPKLPPVLRKRSDCVVHIYLSDIQQFLNKDFQAWFMDIYDEDSRCDIMQTTAHCKGLQSVPSGRYCFNGGIVAANCQNEYASKLGGSSCRDDSRDQNPFDE